MVNRTRRMTPEPYRSMAGHMKSMLKLNPNGSFAKPNASVMWKMRGVGAAGGILIGYGVYQSATNISNAAAHGYGIQAAINEGISWGGAIAGGYAGAKGGAVVGTFFGPVGAVIGGFVGGIGGSIIGGAGGYWTGSQLTGY